MSLRLQYEGQKKLTDITDAHGVFDHGFFLTFPFDANRFQTDLQALPLAAAEIKIVMLVYCNLKYILS